VAFGGFLVYFLLQDQDDEAPKPTAGRPGFPSFPGGGPSGQPTPLLTTPGNRVSKIGSFPALGATIGPDQKRVRFFDRDTGNLYEANFDGTELTKISDSSLAEGVVDVVWSPLKDYFVALFEDQSKNFIYNFRSGLSVDLRQNLVAAAFSPQNNRLAYQNFLTNESSLILVNLDGSRPQTIFSAALPKTRLAWVQTNKLAVNPAPSGRAQGSVITINPSNGSLGQILAGKYGLVTNWSPNGRLVIYSTTDQFGHELSLWLADENGVSIKQLEINTLADKCVWSQDNRIVYCAAPSSWPNDLTLPDDYYKGVVAVSDSFVSLNTETSLPSFILELTDSDAQSLIITPQEDYLLFINRKDGFLYSIRL